MKVKVAGCSSSCELSPQASIIVCSHKKCIRLREAHEKRILGLSR